MIEYDGPLVPAIGKRVPLPTTGKAAVCQTSALQTRSTTSLTYLTRHSEKTSSAGRRHAYSRRHYCYQQAAHLAQMMQSTSTWLQRCVYQHRFHHPFDTVAVWPTTCQRFEERSSQIDRRLQTPLYPPLSLSLSFSCSFSVFVWTEQNSWEGTAEKWCSYQILAGHRR